MAKAVCGKPNKRISTWYKSLAFECLTKSDIRCFIFQSHFFFPLRHQVSIQGAMVRVNILDTEITNFFETKLFDEGISAIEYYLLLGSPDEIKIPGPEHLRLLLRWQYCPRRIWPPRQITPKANRRPLPHVLLPYSTWSKSWPKTTTTCRRWFLSPSSCPCRATAAGVTGRAAPTRSLLATFRQAIS